MSAITASPAAIARGSHIGIRAARSRLAVLLLVALPASLQAAIPVSAEFVPKAPDPRGGSPGYNTFNRLPDGLGVTYAGFSHDFRGNNAVVVYDPVADAWQIVVPHTPWIEMPVAPSTTMPPYEGRGLDFLSNRDDHATLVVDNQWWVLEGQVGATVVGNYRGVLDTQTWQWTIDDGANAFGPTGTSPGAWYNSASGWLPSLDIGYIFAGTRRGNPTDALTRIERNAPGSSPPFRFTEYWNSESDTPAFQGAERLEYVSNQHFVRSPYVYVYGGRREVRRPVPPYDPLYRISSYDLWQLKITDPPQLTVLSTNTLPVGQRIEGMALLAYYDAARDFAVVTNGKLVNLYHYATGLWHNIPVLTAPDPDRESPSSQGAGHAGFYSPEVDQYIILGVASKTYGLKLNFTGTTVPSAPLNVVATAGNASATVSFLPPLTTGGSPITSYAVTSNPPGGVDQQAGTAATTRMITGLTNGIPYTFTVVAINAIGAGPPSAPSNSVTPTPGITVPGAPTAVVASAGNGTATVSFTPPASNGGSTITGYTVTSNPAGGVDVHGGSPATTHLVSNLVNGVSYTFTVTARNAIGTGAPSAPSNAVVPQGGGACAGFADVAAEDAICPSVEWLKNRAITLGCAASQYCPSEPLTRLAMAALVQRLGGALTPIHLTVEAAPGALDVAAQPVVCASGTVTAAAYPRAARVQFALSGAAGGAGVFAALPVASLDGGAAWVSPVQNAFRSAAMAGLHAALNGEAVIAMAPGTEYRFAAQLFTVSGSSAFTGVRCQLVVEIVNQNGAFTPYDPWPDALRGHHGDLY